MCLFHGNPAKAAARLQTWQFDTTQNRLFFSTETGVQPQVKLLHHPKRLVIDLPGIVSEDAIGDQPVGGAVVAVRVTQLDRATTRIVMELDPNYDLDPQKIRVWGLTSQQWVVQLPGVHPPNPLPDSAPQPPEVTPSQASPTTSGTGAKSIELFEPPPLPRDQAAKAERQETETVSETMTAPEPSSGSPLPPLLSRNQVSHAEVSGTATLIQGVLATPEGFFLRTEGLMPPIQVYRTRDANQGRQLVIDFINTMIAPSLTADAIPNNVYGVRRWNVTQFRTTPPAVRVTLALDQVSPDWQVVPLAQGGIMLSPMGTTASQIPTPPTTVVLPVIRTGPGTSPPPAIASSTMVTPPPQAGRGMAPPPIASSGERPPVPAASPVQVTPMAPTTQAAPTTPPPQQQRMVVMLDPGHGGADPGAVGIGGLQEKAVVIAVARHVAQVLQSQGVMVQMTRQADQTVDLQPRVDMAEAADATLFVSIHANAVNMQRPEVNGLETYYYSDSGFRLASVLHHRVMSTMAMNDRGVRQARFFVLRRTSMPAALIEIGFVTGAADAPKLRDPTWQVQMGQAIAAGILDYIRTGQR